MIGTFKRASSMQASVIGPSCIKGEIVQSTVEKIGLNESPPAAMVANSMMNCTWAAVSTLVRTCLPV